ncbi:hypothetical protein M8C13_22410 [Crossiella sp. SN42]|uniref:DUF6766 family protein n=1 Tax=Crossiella sp. SN42 TaxID=2944808 RepID=UPI00207C16CB|nr:DUF6766 family protein [Crossiella sp. SN42]MCO1578510.1 hypothetical protein [Crossiella sp. SN42]
MGAKRDGRHWLWLNGLSLVMFGSFLIFLVLQSVFGWQANNNELADFGRPALAYWDYVLSGDFGEQTFENWESEFLQMGSYVLLTAFLVQKGSPESNPLDGYKDPESRPHPDAPAPVKRGGWVLKLYENSLGLALIGMFLLSFTLHLLTGTAAYNDQQSLHGKPPVGVGEFLGSSEFWSQSMQNWQSEFLAVGVLIVFTIFLRQRNSAQSKNVAEPHHETGA